MQSPVVATTPVSTLSLYERMGERTTQPFALQLLDRLDPIKGLSIIDVAAGTGGLAVAAADRGGRVLATDLNPAMIERTQERLRPFNLCRAELMDFQSLTGADAIADIAVSNFGVLAYPTWRQGLIEIIRVTKPDSRVALVMWTHRDDCSPAHLMKRVFEGLFPGRSPWPAGMFPLFSEETLKSTLQELGCAQVDVQVAHADWTPFSSPDVTAECDPMFKGFPGYAALTSEEAKQLHTSLDEAFRSYSDSDGTIYLPTEAFIVIGRKAL